MNRLKYFLCGIMLFLCGCSTSVQNTDDRPYVMTTIFSSYDFARQIAGDKVNVNLLLPPGSEAHSFEPSPKDIINIQNADLFIYTGGKSDSWIDDILSTIDTGNMEIIRLMDVCETVEEELIEGMQETDHNHNEEDQTGRGSACVGNRPGLYAYSGPAHSGCGKAHPHRSGSGY